MKKLLILIGIIFLTSSITEVKAQNQGPVSPPDGLPEAAAYSIFYENYKNEDYKSAIRYGRWIWKGMPRNIKGYAGFDLVKNLDRLVTAYSELAKQMEDPSLRSAYLDTTEILFEKVFSEMKENEYSAFEWHFDRGRFYQENSDFIENAMTKAAEDYRKAFELKPEEFTKMGDGYYTRVMLQQMVSDDKKDLALKYINQAEPYASQQLKEYFDDTRNQLFDSPKERMAFLEGKLKENPKDQETMRQLRDIYEQQGMNDKAQELSQKLYELDPSYENTMALANFAVRNANYSNAVKYLKEAINMGPSDEDKAQMALKLSETYLNMEELQQARQYARQAASLDSDWGQPHIQLAAVYANAINQCTSGRKLERTDRAVYWLVLDHLNRAKNIDSSVSNNAQRQIQSYKPVAPSSEDIFFTNEWEKGKTIKIDGSLNSCYSWINETTTVRTVN